MAELSTEDIATKVLGLAKPLMITMGVELVEMKVGRHQSDVLIQIITDKSMGGISIGECVKLNKALVAAIDETAFLPEDCYSLEVMSPGLDRPLTTYRDFFRNLNADIRFYFEVPINGKKEMEALLISVTEVNLTVVTKKKVEIVIPLANIVKGMLVI